MTNDSRHVDHQAWQKHIVRAGTHCQCLTNEPDPDNHREHVEPWLSALFQAEHLNLLAGSGLTTAVARIADVPAVDMNPAPFPSDCAEAVQRAAKKSADHLGRQEPNIEDQIRVVHDLIGGLRILAGGSEQGQRDPMNPESARKFLSAWESALDNALQSFLTKVLATERGIDAVLSNDEKPESEFARRLLGGFLLPFASRTVTRERLHIFTTNYDRLIEYGCDLLGLRIVDRFVGNLAPVFRSSRLGIDLHYNPPGIPW